MTAEFRSDQKAIGRSREILSLDELLQTREYNSLLKLLNSSVTTSLPDGTQIYSLAYPSKSLSQDELMGMILFASHCFDRHMGFDGMSVLFSENASISLLIKEGFPVSIIGEKYFVDKFRNRVYYLDIAGTQPDKRGKGYASKLGRNRLVNFIKNYSEDVVFLTRTQNPQMVGAARGITKGITDLSPFWGQPSPKLIESLNSLINDGVISRSHRSDTYFDASKAFIHWNSYGETGDGTTWEDMIKQLQGELDWNKSSAQMMISYIQSNGSSIVEARTKGHAFILAGEISSNI